MAMNFGVMVSFIIGEVLPDDTDIIGLETTEKWRVSYFWFPLSCFLTLLFAFKFTIRYDSIKNLIKNGNIDEAREFIQLVYKNADP